MKTRWIKNKHRGLLSSFPPGHSVCEGSSGVLVYTARIISNRALTGSVSTSQRQMGSLMQWCSYVRPATAAAPVCLYRSTERENERGRKCKRELVNKSLCVCVCVCVGSSCYVCADTHTHTHQVRCAYRATVCATDGEWGGKSGWIDLLSWVWWTRLPL